eukprot:jgi/Chlat1/646/Chrsp103S01056
MPEKKDAPAPDSPSAAGPASAAASPAGDATKKGSGLLGWLRRGDRQQPVKAKLGEENRFYFDAEQKRWRERGADDDAAPEPLPPPPKSQSATPLSSRPGTPTPPAPDGKADGSAPASPMPDVGDGASDSDASAAGRIRRIGSESSINGRPPVPTPAKPSFRDRGNVRNRYVDPGYLSTASNASTDSASTAPNATKPLSPVPPRSNSFSFSSPNGKVAFFVPTPPASPNPSQPTSPSRDAKHTDSRQPTSHAEVDPHVAVTQPPVEDAEEEFAEPTGDMPETSVVDMAKDDVDATAASASQHDRQQQEEESGSQQQHVTPLQSTVSEDLQNLTSASAMAGASPDWQQSVQGQHYVGDHEASPTYSDASAWAGQSNASPMADGDAAAQWTSPDSSGAHHYPQNVVWDEATNQWVTADGTVDPNMQQSWYGYQNPAWDASLSQVWDASQSYDQNAQSYEGWQWVATATLEEQTARLAAATEAVIEEKARADTATNEKDRLAALLAAAEASATESSARLSSVLQELEDCKQQLARALEEKAKEEAATSAAEFDDLLVALGQEGAKVAALSEELATRGVDVDALIERVEEEYGFGDVAEDEEPGGTDTTRGTDTEVSEPVHSVSDSTLNK